jgi:hypothetical protein
MGQISESYASPGLRLGLLLEDHPNATYTFELKSGEELGIPDKFGGDGDFCLCTINFPNGRSKATAYKPLPARGDADQWNIICTKTLGRALKRAGYPDDLRDLKALVLWRQREAEIDAIRGGTAQISLPSANAIAELSAPDPVGQALDAAGVRDPEHTGADEGDGEDYTGGDDEAVDAEIVEDFEHAPTGSDSDRSMVAELVDGLNKREFANYLGYLKTIGAPEEIERMSDAHVEDVLAWLDPDGGD